MRLLTPSGDLVYHVRERSWPLAHVDYPRPISQAQRGITLSASSTEAVRTATYVKLYKSNPWVNACVRSIAWGVSRQVMKVYENQSDKQKVRIRSDIPGQAGRPSSAQNLDYVLQHPSPGWGPRRFWRRNMIDELIFGNALVKKVRDPNTSQLKELWNVPWRKVTVQEGDLQPIAWFEVLGIEKSLKMVPEDCIHFSTADDPDSPIGTSPMEGLRYTLALYEALQRHLVAFFENSARPSGNLKLQPGAQSEAIKLMRNQLREMYSAPENAGKALVTTGDWQPITQNADQTAIIELVKLSREEIAGVFRIPPPIIGVLERAIHSNIKELREQYIRDVVGPWGGLIEDDVMSQLVNLEPNMSYNFVEFDTDEALRPDPESRAKMGKDQESTLTTNERRRRENLPDLPYEEADTVIVTPGAGFLGVAYTEGALQVEGTKGDPAPAAPAAPAGKA